MGDLAYLAWRYLAYHRFKTFVLVASITLIVYLPIGLRVLVSESSRQLTARAESTPLLIGAKGSPLELVLRTLYFASDLPAEIPFSEVTRVDESRLAKAIPIHARFHTRDSPIVGTSLDYFSFRRLNLSSGRRFAILGECVVGAKAAKQSDVGVGDSLLSKPESVFDIAGVYPLKMRVVGILEPNGTPDDQAVFVDVKTAWVIAGLAHGHQDLSRSDATDGVLRRDGNQIVANASVVQYNEITASNVASFHFHRNPETFPITSVIAIPQNDKSGTLLRGRYLGDTELVQIVEPANVMGDLLETVLTVRRYFSIAVAIVSTATLATMTLVFVLSLQLRRREIETIMKIGGSRIQIVGLIGSEIAGVLLLGVTLSAILAVITASFSTWATQWIVQMS